MRGLDCWVDIDITLVNKQNIGIPWGIVDHRVLQEGPEHEEDADPGPDIDGLGVGHGGQGVLDAGLGGGHRQQSRHPESHPGGNLANVFIQWWKYIENFIEWRSSQNIKCKWEFILTFCRFIDFPYRLVIEPEREPGHGHRHGAGDVDLRGM